MEELVKTLKETIIGSYEKYGEEKSIIFGNRAFSGLEMADEIRNETEIGKKAISLVIRLTLDLLKRNKIK